MADGCHLGFRFWPIISASINIFAPNLVSRCKIGSPRGPSAQKSGFRKFKMADSRHLGFRFRAVISASLNIVRPNLVEWWKIDSPRGPIAQKSGFWKSKMAVIVLNFKKSYYNSVVEWDVTVKLKYHAQAKKPTSASKTSSCSHFY